MTLSCEARSGAIHLRPAGSGDAELLYAVYASTRTEELAQVDWDEAQKEGFLRMQFQAQSQHYSSQYAGAEFQIILLDEEPAGRLYVHRRPDEIRVMDIALLPAFRGRGVGTTLMKQLLEEGERTSRTVSIHVELFNPARHWYERLGFLPMASNGVYQLMEWRPGRSCRPEGQMKPTNSPTP
jgi:ribosomal protein S18 acetylase RimI-like enzyme